MALFVLADPHLANGVDKPMAVFGPHWNNHTERIRTHWLELVAPEDTVVLPGDISWALTLAEALPDLQFLHELPGSKILSRGNHDYWWNSITRVRSHLPDGMIALQNDAAVVGPAVVCGTRGWTCPGSSSWNGQEDEKIFKREVIRLQLTLQAAAKLRKPGQPLIAMLHYPPFNERQETSAFTELLESHQATAVVYGHLHGVTPGYAIEGERNGVTYKLVSCDYLGFKPIPLLVEP